jgi:hypothetical protein
VGDVGRTTKDTLGLRTGTRAEVERVLDEEDGVNSDPEDFIDLEHTDSDRDSEADRIEKDVNSDDERFVDGKKVDGKTLSVVFCDDEIQKKKNRTLYLCDSKCDSNLGFACTSTSGNRV